MNSHNRHIIFLVLVVLSVLVCGCSNKSNSDPVQLNVGSGEYVARINIKDYGAIDLRLFKNVAHDSVNSFIQLANSGYYNNLPIISVIKDYCLAFESSSVQDFSFYDMDFNTYEKEMKEDYYPINGALCLTDLSDSLNAKSFIIINSDASFISELEELLSYRNLTLEDYCLQAYGTDISAENADIFRKYGGAPWLYGHCIVFGQVYSGFDVLENLSNSAVSSDGLFTPSEEIIVESVEVIESTDK